MTHAGNRILWTVIGLLLIAIGVAGILGSLGRLPGTAPDATLLWSGLLDLWRTIAPWGPAVVIGIGLLFALLGYVLLDRQLRDRGGAAMGTFGAEHAAPNDGAPGPVPDLPGRTWIRGAVLARGLERDLTRDPLVRRASVLLTGAVSSPDLWIQLHVGPRTRLPAVRDHVRAAVERFRTTSGLDPRHLDVTARIDSSPGRRPG